MGSTTKARLIRIGNSRGIRIPKVWLDQLGLEGEVELAMARDQLVIRAARLPREGWDEAFRAMAHRGDDTLLEDTVATKWESEEWQW